MSRVVIHTHLPAAAKITFELDASRVAFKALGGGDGVPPGMTLLDGEQMICWVGAQDAGVIVVEDDRFVSVEASIAHPV